MWVFISTLMIACHVNSGISQTNWRISLNKSAVACCHVEPQTNGLSGESIFFEPPNITTMKAGQTGLETTMYASWTH